MKINNIIKFSFGGYSKLLILSLFAFFISCERHDFLDTITKTGNIAPQAYWEIASTTVSAGSEVAFTTQYYSSNKEIDHSEVWYNLYELESKSVSCAWLTTFNYNYTYSVEVEKRILQKISTYTHDESLWSDSLHAYTFTDVFPTSNTLRSVSWNNPTEFDSTKFEAYFGVGFMQNFKDSVEIRMQFSDYKSMYLGLGKINDFKAFTDSTFNENKGAYDYHFPLKDGVEIRPYSIDSIYETLTFEELIETSAFFGVTYKRSYSIDAVMKVFNQDNVFGTTATKRISFN